LEPRLCPEEAAAEKYLFVRNYFWHSIHFQTKEAAVN